MTCNYIPDEVPRGPGWLTAPGPDTDYWEGTDPLTGLVVRISDKAIGAEDEAHRARLMAEGLTWEAATEIVARDTTVQSTRYWLHRFAG